MRSTPKPAVICGIRRALAAAICTAAALGAVTVAAPAAAQTYPNKTIRMVVPHPVSTVSDMVGRLLANHMSKSMGQSIVVENIPGGAKLEYARETTC